MKLYKIGEKSQAICQFCNQIRPTTFTERDISLSSGKGMVPNVLIAVCDQCDRMVSIPQQSVPRIQGVVHYSRHAIETRIPRHLQDALLMSCYELGYGANESKQTILFRYYLQKANQMKGVHARFSALLDSEEAQGKSSARFSIKLNDELYNIFLKLERDTKLNKAEVVKGIIVQIKRELLDEKNKTLVEDLREIMLLAG